MDDTIRELMRQHAIEVNELNEKIDQLSYLLALYISDELIQDIIKRGTADVGGTYDN